MGAVRRSGSKGSLAGGCTGAVLMATVSGIISNFSFLLNFRILSSFSG